MPLKSYSARIRRHGRTCGSVIIFFKHWQPSRAAARRVYQAAGHKGRISLNREKMKRRGRKFAPPEPPKCSECYDTGEVEVFYSTFYGPEQDWIPCACVENRPVGE